MKTFNKATKQKYIDRAIMHRKNDEIIQGSYWINGKGCCVGCLAHVSDNAHSALQEQTGIPEWLSEIADTLHEGLGNDLHKTWPEKFITAIPKNKTHEYLEKNVKAPFLVVVLKSTLETFDHKEFPDVKRAVDQSINLWERDDVGSDAFTEAAGVAEIAAWAAWAAGAAGAAAGAAGAAAGAAWAAWAAEAAAGAAAWAAAWAAEAAKYKFFADELIKILNRA